jgi:exodeoxyribonuclease V gamma subunit
VLDGYQNYRTDWLGDWADGHDTWCGYEGKPASIDFIHAWQAQLWRDIRADVGEAFANASRVNVHSQFMSAIKVLVTAYKTTGQRPANLPLRIVVFGISSLPMQTVEALAELGQLCQVVVLVQNPCQHYWEDFVEGTTHCAK